MGSNWKNLATLLHNRYIFLMSVQTCTQHEATLSCMLSSFEIVEKLLEDELEPHSVLVHDIHKGKTNQNDSATVLQAKFIRHCDPKFCEQGALSTCPFARFCVHDEEFDLTNNAGWFKVRTAVAVNNSKKQFAAARFRPMSASAHHDTLATVCQHFNCYVSM